MGKAMGDEKDIHLNHLIEELNRLHNDLMIKNSK